MHQITLIASFSLCFLAFAGFAKAAASSNESLDKYFGLEALEPSKVLDILKQLKRSSSSQLAKTVDELLEASQLSDKKCANCDLSLWDRLLELHAERQLNIVPFLSHFRAQQESLCRARLAERLSAALAGVGRKERQELKLLLDGSLELTDVALRDSSISAGIIKLLYNDLSESSTNFSLMFRRAEGGEQNFARYFNQRVGKLCALLAQEQIQNLLLPSHQCSASGKQSAIFWWLERAELCNYVLRFSADLQSLAYKSLTIRNNRQSI